MTFYLGVVDRARDGSWGAWFPDLPGCNAMGDSMDGLFANSVAAIRDWAEDALGREGVLPTARANAAVMDDPDVRQAVSDAAPFGCLIQVPLVLNHARSVRANISLDVGLLDAIDRAAARLKVTRSAFLASAAREKIDRGA